MKRARGVRSEAGIELFGHDTGKRLNWTPFRQISDSSSVWHTAVARTRNKLAHHRQLNPLRRGSI